MSQRQPSAEQLQAQCDEWNNKYEVGQRVRLLKDHGQTMETATRSHATVLSGHTAVAWVDGIAGCFLLSRLTPIGPVLLSEVPDRRRAQLIALARNVGEPWTDAIAELLKDDAAQAKACAAARSRLAELLAGDGFTGATDDFPGHCPMCGRSEDAGHRESCARYVLADVDAILRGEA